MSNDFILGLVLALALWVAFAVGRGGGGHEQ
jgi:hypothetical protein